MSIQLSANGDSLANATDATFFMSARTPLTIAVWISATWGNATGSLVGLYNGAGGTAVQIGCRATTMGQCVIWTWGGGILVQSTGIVIPNNVWTHIAYTYDGTTHKLYINGALNNTATTTQLAGNLNQVFINGYSTGGTNETANFQLDTYDLYNRALSADEIQTVYNTAGNRHGIVYGIVARYEFDEAATGAAVTTVYNQTDHPPAVTDLISNSARTPRVTYSDGYANRNLRTPL